MDYQLRKLIIVVFGLALSCQVLAEEPKRKSRKVKQTSQAAAPQAETSQSAEAKAEAPAAEPKADVPEVAKSEPAKDVAPVPAVVPSAPATDKSSEQDSLDYYGLSLRAAGGAVWHTYSVDGTGTITATLPTTNTFVYDGTLQYRFENNVCVGLKHRAFEETVSNLAPTIGSIKIQSKKTQAFVTGKPLYNTSFFKHFYLGLGYSMISRDVNPDTVYVGEGSSAELNLLTGIHGHLTDSINVEFDLDLGFINQINENANSRTGYYTQGYAGDAVLGFFHPYTPLIDIGIKGFSRFSFIKFSGSGNRNTTDATEKDTQFGGLLELRFKF